MGILERLYNHPTPPARVERNQDKRQKKFKKKWIEVDRYIAQRLGPSDPVLDMALKAREAAGLPDINVSPNQGKLRTLLSRKPSGPIPSLRSGTLAGYSTIWLARALAPGGRLITLEAKPRYAKIALANIAHAGLSNRVDLRLGRALDSLPALSAEGPFDFVFVDADHENMPEYFQWALKLSRRGSLIVVDNVVRRGTVLHAGASKPEIQGIRRFYDLVAAEPKVSMTAIQTVGVKGHDGFAHRPRHC